LRKIVLFLILWQLPNLISAQEFNYVHYDTKDGLAGSTVYDLAQDVDGFMWFATENGLSRYDGTNFKTFTVKDGLPDNEVLKVFADSKGRVWIGTFSKEICFYYKGKIYNKENSTLCKKIKLTATIHQFIEYEQGKIAMIDKTVLHIIEKNDSLQSWDLKKITHKEITHGIEVENDKLVFTVQVEKGTLKRFYLVDSANQVVFKYDGEYKSDNGIYKFGMQQYNYGAKQISLLQKPGFIMSEQVSSGEIFFNTINGTWIANTINKKWDIHLLEGKKVTRSFVDLEKNFWFTTLGEGVFKLPSKDIVTFKSKEINKPSNKEVFSIVKFNNAIYGGLGFSKVIIVDSNKSISEVNYSSALSKSENYNNSNRLYTCKTLSSGELILGFDAYLVKIENDKASFNYSFPIKSIAEINADNILIGTGSCAFTMRLKNLQIIDTVWKERCTKVFYDAGNYYIGTISGLYKIDENKNTAYLGNIHKTLSRRITDIKKTKDGNLWIASSDNGIVAINNNTLKTVIKDTNGLSSNNCKTLFLDKQFLWVGTDNGLNKIDISKSNVPMVQYSMSDGLPSNIINAIYTEDSIVWVGTPEGLTYFKENKISSASICNLSMLQVVVASMQMPIDSNYQLSYKNNNINFHYVAVSFKSGGQITYYYRLKGLHEDWRSTTKTDLDYAALASGNYTLELYAINKFGVHSKTITIHFCITTPFWKTGWFYTLIFLILLTGILWFFQKRNRKTKEQLEEKNKIQQQFAALEQQALQAQMNPHFIFNCLNSIQQYILTNDKEKANEYLTGFASLVRQTLDYSSKKNITIAQEANYLKQYVEMEKMRFGNNFNYIISIDQSVKTDFIEIPALLLQPFVENSLRHGLRYKKDSNGVIKINFTIENTFLICSVIDNGIGRKQSAMYKSQQHIEYQSKGMTLTQKRIDLLNKVNNTNMEVKIIDLLDNNNNGIGTQVTIKIPL
jgi:Histidine kinase/Y_Y_Y domain/Two component regulator propeller